MKEELNLGQLIEKLEELIKKYPKEVNDHLSFDFGSAYPTGFCSYRGYYNELSLEFSGEYDGKYSLKDFLKVCEETVDKTFTGWKGGDFKMNKNTPITVACGGRTSNTKIIDVIKSKYYGFEIITENLED